MNIERYKRILYILKTKLLYGSRMKHLGKSVVIISPLKIFKKERVSIGDYTVIGYKAWLGATPSTGCKSCELVIGANCAIGNFNHIYATQSIKIGDSVLTADKVYISDNIHGYEDISRPVLSQKVVQKKPVEIGDGSWIGENVCIIGASVGKHCIIGANAVVTHDIPDYSIAVGSPAKVVKFYNFEKESWERI